MNARHSGLKIPLAVALAMSTAAPSVAQVTDADVVIDISVASVLSVSTSSPTATMTVDSMPAEEGDGTFMSPSSSQVDPTNINDLDVDIPVLTVLSNFAFGAVEVDFPRTGGFRRACDGMATGGRVMGEAVRVGGSAGIPEDILGVRPQLAKVVNEAGDMGPRMKFGCSDSTLRFTDGGPFDTDEVHQFALGVSTRLDNTLETAGSPYAPPGLYRIELSVTIVP